MICWYKMIYCNLNVCRLLVKIFSFMLTESVMLEPKMWKQRNLSEKTQISSFYSHMTAIKLSILPLFMHIWYSKRNLKHKMTPCAFMRLPGTFFAIVAYLVWCKIYHPITSPCMCVMFYDKEFINIFNVILRYIIK